MKIDDDVKARIDQIDKEEFEAAVKQLRLGKLKLSDEFLVKMKKQATCNKLNRARMRYIAGLLACTIGDHDYALECFLLGLQSMLMIEVEKKP